MESLRTVQTAFRFKPEMVSRMKNKARLLGKSLNNYVEELIETDLASQDDRYDALYKQIAQLDSPKCVSEEVKALSGFKTDFSTEDIEKDERLAYILEK